MPEHAHDWPVLSLFVIGAYQNQTEFGEQFVAGPSAVLYRAGAAHRNTASTFGFEQIEIEFDPAWLRCPRLPDAPVQRWIGGRVGAEARRLARICATEASEAELREAVQRFLEGALREPRAAAAAWIEKVASRLRQDASAGAADLARAVSRHPSWLGSAYRRATGERLPETAARMRVEHAACLLRETDMAYAGVASEAGFCDQSHMNRTFKRVLGRTPSAVRQDGNDIRQPGG